MSAQLMNNNRTDLKLIQIITETRQSKHCGGFSIYIFDNSKSIMKKVKINGQVGQGEEDGLVWSGLCQKDSQDDFDSEYIGFYGLPDD